MRDQVEFIYSYNTDTDDFISNGNESIIRLQSIPNYNSEIKIKSINKSGIESSNILSMVISKTPPWYQRTESFVAYIVLLILFILGFKNGENNPLPKRWKRSEGIKN